jgi:hypothetical protein
MRDLFVCIATVTLLAGCETQQQAADRLQPKAVETAQEKGSFELDCPSATAKVLSREMIQAPATIYGDLPPNRAEYTVGVAGCGKRIAYTVVCARNSTGCFAGSGPEGVLR